MPTISRMQYDDYGVEGTRNNKQMESLDKIFHTQACNSSNSKGCIFVDEEEEGEGGSTKR